MAGYAPHRSLINILLFAAALLGCVGITRAELTKALEIRSLSYDEAKAGLEVKLRGTVTFIEGPGAVFVQDETAGTFFRPEKLNKLRPGDVVEVTGRTQPGNYLPGIGLAPYRIIGHGPLPESVKVVYDDLTSAKYHYQRFAIEGIARSVTPIGEGRSVFRIDVASRIVEAWVDAGIEDESAIVDSRVRVTGLAAGGINRRRQLVQPYLRTRDSSEITILEHAAPETAVPRVAAADLLTFRIAGQGNHRVRIDGVVTACPSKVLVFVRSGQTALGLRFFVKKMFLGVAGLPGIVAGIGPFAIAVRGLWTNAFFDGSMVVYALVALSGYAVSHLSLSTLAAIWPRRVTGVRSPS